MKPELAIGRLEEIRETLLMALDFKTIITSGTWEGEHILAIEGVPHVEQAVEDLIALRKDIEKDLEPDPTPEEALDIMFAEKEAE